MEVGLGRPGVVAAESALAGSLFLCLAMAVALVWSARRNSALARVNERLREVNRALADGDAALQRSLSSANAELNRRVARLSVLLDVGRELVFLDRTEDILARISQVASALVDAEATAVRILREDSQELVLVSQSGLSDAYLEARSRMPLAGGPAEAVRTGRPATGAEAIRELDGPAAGEGAAQPRFSFSVPLLVRDKAVGVLTVYTQNVCERTGEEIAALEVLAAYAAVAIENSQLYSAITQTNRQLMFLKRYNENILESIPTGILVLDGDMRVTTWNSGMERILRVPRHAVLGRDYFECFPEARTSGFDLIVRRCMQTGRTRTIHNYRQLLAGGDLLISRRIVSPLRSPEGKVEGAIVVVEDVTEKVRLGEQLRRADRLRVVGEFAAGAAHEINNPLGVISASVDLLSSRLARLLPDHPELTRPLAIIDQEVTRCSTIVRGLLTFSRHDGTSASQVDVNEVAEDSIALVAARAAACSVEIVTDLARDLPPVWADPQQLKQVFLNLGLNALEAMENGGRLTVTTRTVMRPRVGDGSRSAGIDSCPVGVDRGSGEIDAGSGEVDEDSDVGLQPYVQVRFHDTGCGIPPEVLDKIFDPFFTTKPSGTGLGLAVSHGIVERHGGTITVTSQKGSGTTFYVDLPVRPLAETEHGSESALG